MQVSVGLMSGCSYVRVFQEEALSHRIKSEEPITSLMSQLDSEVH